ncbi:hypothetical protein [Roseivirga misakiensis]|uniref:hypothetical protein n=1 Tax=Roseivirga misakiensis TaxID=1563681 RepID=UPI000A4E0EFE|nr:hypothetical protein [Roseivirga misakiensis]
MQKVKLDLSDLTVITEAANGDYSYLPFIAAASGARKVYALGRDSAYGSYSENRQVILDRASEWGFDDVITVAKVDEFDIWHEGDIITNSGMLRPINEQMLGKFKNTAVIPLMWETWEFRPHEIDIEACQSFEIPVIGTDEQYKDIDMYHYPGMLAMKLLFEVNSDFSSDKIVLIGGGLTGSLIARTLSKFNNDLLWYADEALLRITALESRPYSSLEEVLMQNGVETIFIAEHAIHDLLIGQNAKLSFKDLAEKFTNLKVVHLCGNIDTEDLNESQISFYPQNIAPSGYMSVLPTVISPKPTLKLLCGGLKVGELAVRNRLEGASVEETIRKTVEYGIGQDFEGGFMNYGRA